MDSLLFRRLDANLLLFILPEIECQQLAAQLLFVPAEQLQRLSRSIRCNHLHSLRQNAGRITGIPAQRDRTQQTIQTGVSPGRMVYVIP